MMTSCPDPFPFFLPPSMITRSPHLITPSQPQAPHNPLAFDFLQVHRSRRMLQILRALYGRIVVHRVRRELSMLARLCAP